MSMVSQPEGCRRVPLGKIRPAWTQEIWSGNALVGVAVRRPTAT
jgi:hypothetical protein